MVGKEPQESVLSAPQILGVPLLLLANKQDSPDALSVEDIRTDYEDWYRHKMENARRTYTSDGTYSPGGMYTGDGEGRGEERRERIASLDVMGVSALEG